MKEHDEIGIQILLAAPPTPLCKALTRHGFFKRFSSEHLFPTVTSAVSFARDGNRVVRKLAIYIYIADSEVLKERIASYLF